MKRNLFILLVFISIAGNLAAQEHRRYALVWNDEFNSSELNTRVWSKIWRSTADWAIHMSSHDTLYALDGGDLVLRGMYNDFLPNDKASFLTGGVWSIHRKSFGFGRVEVRAKFDEAQGFWPAIWMLPQLNQAVDWPYGGEIDIMEHFRSNSFVNQTVHSYYTYNLGKRNRPSQVAYPAYNQGEYNTYGMERFEDSLVFFVNGKRTFNYPRFRKGVDGQFPFSNQDYYLILDAQLGRDRSPYIDTASLPVELRIDYVRYYELDTKTDVIPEPKEFQQLATKKKKLRKVVYDEKTQFDRPDEYRLVVKCGKATISGNRLWAENTLAQLVDENGCVANLEVHDWGACSCRGIALDPKKCLWSFDELAKLIDLMAFYKLNYLHWSGEGACSAEEVDWLREHARDLGITMVDDMCSLPDVGLLMLGKDSQFPAMNRVFLHTVYDTGIFLYLDAFGAEELEALMALSERCWRGGDAGEVEGGELSPAGSRLANFKEKVAIHKKRFHTKKQ